jgi:hypothetical protein
VHFVRQAVDPSFYITNANLNNTLKVTGVSLDAKGNKYVSMFEGVHMPIYGLQFHPEKAPWDKKNLFISQSADAIEISQKFLNFFTLTSRLNKHQVRKETLKNKISDVKGCSEKDGFYQILKNNMPLVGKASALHPKGILHNNSTLKGQAHSNTTLVNNKTLHAVSNNKTLSSTKQVTKNALQNNTNVKNANPQLNKAGNTTANNSLLNQTKIQQDLKHAANNTKPVKLIPKAVKPAVIFHSKPNNTHATVQVKPKINNTNIVQQTIRIKPNSTLPQTVTKQNTTHIVQLPPHAQVNSTHIQHNSTVHLSNNFTAHISINSTHAINATNNGHFSQVAVSGKNPSKRGQNIHIESFGEKKEFNRVKMLRSTFVNPNYYQ